MVTELFRPVVLGSCETSLRTRLQGDGLDRSALRDETGARADRKRTIRRLSQSL